MSARVVAVLLLLAGCVRPGLGAEGTAFARLDRRTLYHECIAQLSVAGIPVAPPPELHPTEKQIGLAAYQPLPKRVLVPPEAASEAEAGQALLRFAAEVMTANRWDWKRYADPKTAAMLYRFHLFGLLYQGLFQYLQFEGVLRPGRDEEARYDRERIASRARVAFLRYYAERVETRLRPLYALYEEAIRGLARNLAPDLAKVALQNPAQARGYWKEQWQWMENARSGQRTRGAFYLAWMLEDFDTVDASAHRRELAELRLRGR